MLLLHLVLLEWKTEVDPLIGIPIAREVRIPYIGYVDDILLMSRSIANAEESVRALQAKLQGVGL